MKEFLLFSSEMNNIKGVVNQFFCFAGIGAIGTIAHYITLATAVEVLLRQEYVRDKPDAQLESLNAKITEAVDNKSADQWYRSNAKLPQSGY